MVNQITLTKYSPLILLHIVTISSLELQNIHLPEADRITQMWEA